MFKKIMGPFHVWKLFEFQYYGVVADVLISMHLSRCKVSTSKGKNSKVFFLGMFLVNTPRTQGPREPDCIFKHIACTME